MTRAAGRVHEAQVSRGRRQEEQAWRGRRNSLRSRQAYSGGPGILSPAMTTLDAAAARLRDALDAFPLPRGVAFAYHPLRYAWDAHAAFLARFGRGEGRALFVGMNPGPWGMTQSGVPLADPTLAREWMGLQGRVAAPPVTHPKVPVLGYASTRRDPTGAKFYGWARRRYGTAARFFAEAFVLNHCPLLFLDAAGRGVTLPALAAADARRLLAPCDAHLAEALRALRPRLVLPMGAFAAARVRAVLDAEGLDVPVRPVRHPSPANPANNAGWGDDVGEP